ncbi:signal peptidase I [Brevibacterium luteolum]|uniref:Signal peptidase I n=1 Tax=Brevibacterium luteolum TaxID=199591 RepID=A0A6G8KZS0_9MICO|nr:signal peptidase I [Brevibacterium luteolum]QIN30279.1 signal peptidase I [Brevibacterium luteolum]
MRTLLKWLLWFIAAALTALLLAMVVIPRLMGWAPLTVLTGSMEPTIPVGSQVYVKPIDTVDDIQAGDIITFMPNPDDETLVTHRVVGIGVDGSGEKSFTVQGDANNAPDPEPLMPKQIKGVVIYHLPYAGHLALGIDGQTKLLTITVLGIALIGYALWQVLLIVRARRSRNTGAQRDAADPVAAGEAPVAEEVCTDA